MRLPRSLAAAAGALALVTAACSDKGGTDPNQGKPTTTAMTCDNGSGQSVACDIPLTNAKSFTITLVSIDCKAHDNVLTLVKPKESVLTTDGCYAQPGQQWTFDGPFQSAATMAMTVKSQTFENKPQLKVTRVTSASVPTGTVVFEDGYDTDFNDLIFKVEAPQ